LSAQAYPGIVYRTRRINYWCTRSFGCYRFLRLFYR